MTRDAKPLSPALPGLGSNYVGEHEVAVPDEPEYGMLAKLSAEVFGTFVLVLAGVGTALYAGVIGSGALGVALAFGIAVLAGAVIVGHISGGHFNPAVTLGAAVAGRIKWRAVLPYWLAQVFGGAIAAAVLFIVTASFPTLEGDERAFFAQTANGFREHSPVAAQTGGVGFGILGAFVIELAVTAVFVTVILGATSRRAPRALAPVAIGLTLTAMILVSMPVTNASVNPARSTASALFAEAWAFEQLWLFWAAPLLGAAIAGAVAFVLFEPRLTVVDLDEEDEDLTETQASGDAGDAEAAAGDGADPVADEPGGAAERPR